MSGPIVNSKHKGAVVFGRDTTSFGTVRLFKLNTRVNNHSPLDRLAVNHRIRNRRGNYDSLVTFVVENDQPADPKRFRSGRLNRFGSQYDTREETKENQERAKQ
jgi:hypothetical protein